MRRPTTTQTRRFRLLIARFEPDLQRAFNDAIASVRANINWQALLAALVAGDIDAAIVAVGIDAGNFLSLWQKANEAYIAAATETVATLSIAGMKKADILGIRFDMTNPRAEAWMTSETGRMVQQVASDTQQAVRETIQRGYVAGRGPRDIATDVAGRVAGGTRQGGVVGLDTARAYRLDMVSQGMRTASGVQDLVIVHRDGTLGLKYKVNAATEKAIFSAYRAETSVPDAARIRSENQFANALLKDRAETIARTETGTAVAAGRREEWAQVLEKTGRSENDVIKTWQHGSGGKDPRPHHVAMNGVSVRGLNTPFVFSNGAQLQCAHDPDGAASEVIKCTCDTRYRLLPDVEALR